MKSSIHWERVELLLFASRLVRNLDIGEDHSYILGTFHLDSVMGKSSLPPGFRFNPTDVELVQYYLKRKIMGKKLHVKVVAEVDIYKWAPWDLPGKSYVTHS